AGNPTWARPWRSPGAFAAAAPPGPPPVWAAFSGSPWVRISEQSDQAFQLNPITCFGGIRSVISEQSDHPGEAGKVVA
ncbi:MAG: hypothetical protein M0027_15150, partial [Candidatus Dormibacteraeota bacterium]|nr:hypothetical protein [Candidatus Dormibacteraeota bacterium]